MALGDSRRDINGILLVIPATERDKIFDCSHSALILRDRLSEGLFEIVCVRLLRRGLALLVRGEWKGPCLRVYNGAIAN